MELGKGYIKTVSLGLHMLHCLKRTQDGEYIARSARKKDIVPHFSWRVPAQELPPKRI